MSKIRLALELWARQLEALVTTATELLFGGATSGGKSHFVRVALIIWCLDIPGLQCVLIRKKFDDILKNHVEGPTGFRALLAPLIAAGVAEVTQKHVRFANGSVIAFQHCQDERQFDSAQGVEKHVLVIDEATQISERLIKFFRLWCRMPLDMQATLPEKWRGKFPKIIYTANPIGASVGFFRRRFIKARPPFAVEEHEGFRLQYIPSRAEDNPSTDLAALRGRMASMGELGRVLEEGDWEGATGDFFKEYDDDLHVLPVDNWTPPAHLFKFRTFDWGGGAPAAVYWWAVADSDTEIGGRHIPRGALIAYREWYICDPENPAAGIHMPNKLMAQGIVARTVESTTGMTFTDRLPFSDRGHTKHGLKYTIADEFMEYGCPLTLGNVARVYGWKQMRDRLIGHDGIPMIYFVRSCRYARDYIPALPYHESGNLEDAAEEGEATHSCDAIRLACTLKPIVREVPRESSPPSFVQKTSPAALLKRLTPPRNELTRR